MINSIFEKDLEKAGEVALYLMDNNIITGTDHKNNKALDLAKIRSNEILFMKAKKQYFVYERAGFYHIDLSR